jgi:hypothetical protein
MRQSDHPKYPLPDDVGRKAVYQGPPGRAEVTILPNGHYRFRCGCYLDGAECMTGAAMAFWLKKLGLAFAGWEPAA